MASSNRHWPSMFKSKPCNTHHQWQHDINSSLMSSGCNRASYTSAGCEERSPEPKPRWNPKPEQIRILEAIFNSGMVNPPRDEIRKIRAQLQEYGQVGDANVFYWFQNRKSRSKHKLRHLQNSKNQPQQSQNDPPIKSLAATTTPSSSSSSSEKSSPKALQKTNSITFPNVTDVSHSPTASVNHTYFQSQGEILPDPFFFPVQETGGVHQNGGTSSFTQAFCFPELPNVAQVPEHTIGPCASLLLSEIMNNGDSRKDQEDQKVVKIHLQQNYIVTTHPTSHTSIVPPSIATTTGAGTDYVPHPISQIQGVGELGATATGGPSKSTVFINEVAFEVAAMPFNVREAFGNETVLIHSSGQPVRTNEWGVTLQPLQHGSFYYLI
ncbi:WUSCHEL-related homeobox 9-like [Juglans microcarpa x Juglans regia]|uniref:WUSCHEL-related homeobox 9-like n=1 Tax=Juglans microcarpa x Juglans regia TaxID=2249226 RepID=UPI001B7EE49C|nr:WUSCHEL-related homeobox 9-like [Juglans microcarpa x Juglans regia]XP_041023358.1 WUSCHEL-related homeobox 9-like [Juglans microcarpa x Juglans regia]XP_041023359.1 WUSCHEL-related homeobox 9-like [Juglans microcarpa x Juglans regia]